MEEGGNKGGQFGEEERAGNLLEGDRGILHSTCQASRVEVVLGLRVVWRKLQ